jgi:sphingolipid 8-(E)-desaturase
MASVRPSTSRDGSPTRENRIYPVMSRREVEALIAEGRTVIIVEQYVLKVDAWRKYHPGGDKAILHMVGRDATDEVNWFVPPQLADG